MSDENPKVLIYSGQMSQFDRNQLRKLGITPVKVDSLSYVKPLGKPESWSDVYAIALDVVTDAGISADQVRNQFNVRIRKYFREQLIPVEKP